MDLPPRQDHVGRRPPDHARSGRDGALRWLRRHAAFCLVLLGGAAGRIMDLGSLDSLDTLVPAGAGQHLVGLATGVVVYLLLLRWGTPRWFAALGTVPVLWDAAGLAGGNGALAGGNGALAGGNGALADVVFVLLVSVAMLVLCWRARAAVPAALLVGVTLGAGTALQPVAAPLVLVTALLIPLAATTWSDWGARALAAVLGWAVVAVPYAVWHRAVPDETGSGQAPQPVIDILGAAQDLIALPGPVLGPLLVGCLVLGSLAAAGVGRAQESGMRRLCLVVSLVPVAAGAGALVVGGTDWGPLLPALALWPAVGAVGLVALCRGRRGPSAARPQTDDVDRTALADFLERYGEPALAPVVVVIAAYDEAGSLPRVLSTMPSTVCGLPTDVVVVDDGSTDGTAEAVRSHGSGYAVRAPVNRGQGAAMRLGYRIARGHGAQYIITTDADGQYDAADFPAVLCPILNGTADFVTGSRRLGHHHSDDRFRRAGVLVFACVVSLLIGKRVRDTSFGLRAMRAEVTAAVTLNQPQYQSSELLIGVHSRGYRLVEVPATMHLRTGGSTKKGGNLRYGTRYAGVVLGTWWREGCPAPVGDRIPARMATPVVTRTPPTSR